ncbi:Gfo/Idh/MocA family protein [Lentzea flava]|uniref:Oxidoreductase n=1 Tax=Lentzea flava TaxID=103732 RepID=A0ABQ2UNC1_9PSEU|nr:Gfo/Idh/MocA family oxidoreductase [Lentzea flava]MCP2200107.1 putative dehydrogenase [Lentzea flava]GGU46123.1 oxidoreductase [Lentzea flava]
MKWGVIATGGIAQTVTADMLKVPDVEVIAVSSRDVTRAQAFAERFGIKRAYGDYRELLRDEEVEVVYVATPHAQHHEVTLAALEAGKHVLCEKPLGISSAQVEEMIVKARTEKRFLMEGMWTRFNPLIRKVAGAVAGGEIGEVRTIRADFGFRTDFDAGHRLWAKETAGGSVLDLGIYPIALAHQLLGRPTHIAAHGGLAPSEVDADAGILLGYENGVHALLRCSLVADLGSTAEIVGTEGTIEIDRMYNPTKVIINGVEHETEDRGYRHQIHEVEIWAGQGAVEHSDMPLTATLDIMRTMEEVLDQLGVDYADIVR